MRVKSLHTDGGVVASVVVVAVLSGAAKEIAIGLLAKASAIDTPARRAVSVSNPRAA